MAGDKWRGAPALGPRATLRYWWKQLTSMRTALVLLFALALAAVPGSIVPQRSVSPVAVKDYLKTYPRLGPIFEKIWMFDVYTSPWFSAIYLLLFTSLIGCILPRVAVYVRGLRAEPVLTPKRLTKLPDHAVAPMPLDSDGTSEAPAEALERAAQHLRRKRFRVAVRGNSISAERGYLRELGNLAFHISLVFLLIGAAIGSLYGYRGNVIVVEGQGFSNSLPQYDDITAGANFSDRDLAPFQMRVDDFKAQFEAGPVQTGAARLFETRVTVVDKPGDPPRQGLIEVNKPMAVSGTSVHVLAHGYAPLVTVRDAEGAVAFSGPVPFLPQDGQFTSAGAIKAPDGRPERLAFQGFFLPTAVVNEKGPRSVFPDAVNPELFLNAWYGPPRIESGEPENVYSLDTRGLTQMTTPNGDVFRMQLALGDRVALPNGKGSISFDGYKRWVKLQVSRTPALPVTAGAIGLAVVGLCLSLFIRPRRLWVRVTDEGIEAAGLDRASGRTGLDDDVVDLLTAAYGDELPDPVVDTGADAGDDGRVADGHAPAKDEENSRE
ncbi:MAG: cytochrome c biogenesis protein ResB [Propionibacteriales bacterium]|nr:cytochrome c biogenesis protein ResB [Propionibacteriales bacterium]